MVCKQVQQTKETNVKLVTSTMPRLEAEDREAAATYASTSPKTPNVVAAITIKVITRSTYKLRIMYSLNTL